MKIFSKILLCSSLVGIMGVSLSQGIVKADEIGNEITPRIQRAEVVDLYKTRRDLSNGIMSGQYDQTLKTISFNTSFTRGNPQKLSEYLSSDQKYRIFQYKNVYYLN